MRMLLLRVGGLDAKIRDNERETSELLEGLYTFELGVMLCFCFPLLLEYYFYFISPSCLMARRANISTIFDIFPLNKQNV